VTNRASRHPGFLHNSIAVEPLIGLRDEYVHYFHLLRRYFLPFMPNLALPRRLHPTLMSLNLILSGLSTRRI
jgi:hypothetical protein